MNGERDFGVSTKIINENNQQLMRKAAAMKFTVEQFNQYRVAVFECELQKERKDAQALQRWRGQAEDVRQVYPNFGLDYEINNSETVLFKSLPVLCLLMQLSLPLYGVYKNRRPYAPTKKLFLNQHHSINRDYCGYVQHSSVIRSY